MPGPRGVGRSSISPSGESSLCHGTDSAHPAGTVSSILHEATALSLYRAMKLVQLAPLYRSDLARTTVSFLPEPTVDHSVGSSGRHLPCPFSMPIALLMLILLSPAMARAGCDFPTHIDRNRRTHSIDASVTWKNPAHPAIPRPCTGPTCSQRPFAPTMPVPLERVTAQEWGCNLFQSAFTMPSMGAALEDHQCGDPIRRVSSIFHPPRAFPSTASV